MSATRKLFLLLSDLLIVGICALVGVCAAYLLGSRPETAPVWMSFLGRFHMVLLHLPIGGLVLLAVAEVVRAASDKGPVDTIFAWFAALTAPFAALLGILLAMEGGYNERVLKIHLALGLATALLASWMLLLRLRVQKGASHTAHDYRLALVLAALTAAGAGHFGGTLTHGEGYLTELAGRAWASVNGSAVPAEAEEEGESAAAPGVYAELIAPIFEENCYRCHSGSKKRGGLQLDSMEAVLAGGNAGQVLIPGDPDNSLLIQYVELPLDADDHMPPSNAPQPSEAQVAALRWWTAAGAPGATPLSELDCPDSVMALLNQEAPEEAAVTETPVVEPAVEPAPAEAAAESAPEAVDAPTESAVEPAPAEAAPDPATEPAPAPVKTASAAETPAGIYTSLVAPIFEANCYRCHAGDKKKGGLQVDSMEALEAGGGSGPVVVPGAPDESLLIQFIEMPLDADDHMPPSNAPQPSETQVAALRWWVGAGLPSDVAVSEADMPESVKALLQTEATSEEAATEAAPAEEAPVADAVDEAAAAAAARELLGPALQAVQAEFPGALTWVSEQSDTLFFTAVSFRADFGDEQLAKLAPVAAYLQDIDLAGTQVTARGLDQFLPLLERIERLNLSNTALDGMSLLRLPETAPLASVNLFNSKADDGTAVVLARQIGLKNLYLGQTEVGPAALRGLEAALPGCEVVGNAELTIVEAPESAAEEKADEEPKEEAEKTTEVKEAPEAATKPAADATPEAKPADADEPKETAADTAPEAKPADAETPEKAAADKDSDKPAEKKPRANKKRQPPAETQDSPAAPEPETPAEEETPV